MSSSAVVESGKRGLLEKMERINSVFGGWHSLLRGRTARNRRLKKERKLASASRLASFGREFRGRLMLEPLEERIVPATGVIGFEGSVGTGAVVFFSSSPAQLLIGGGLGTGQYATFDDLTDNIAGVALASGGGLVNAPFKILSNESIGGINDAFLIAGDSANVTVSTAVDFGAGTVGNNISLGGDQFTFIGGSIIPGAGFNPNPPGITNLPNILTNTIPTAKVNFVDSNVGIASINGVNVPGNLVSLTTSGEADCTIFVGQATGAMTITDDDHTTTFDVHSDVANFRISGQEGSRTIIAGLTDFDGGTPDGKILLDVTGSQTDFGPAGSITSSSGADLTVNIAGTGGVGTITTQEAAGPPVDPGNLLGLTIGGDVNTINVGGNVGDLTDVATPTLIIGGNLGTMTVSGDIEAGAVIDPLSIGKISVTGSIGVNGGPGGFTLTKITTTDTLGKATIGTIESINGSIGFFDPVGGINKEVDITAGGATPADWADITDGVYANVGQGDNNVVGGGIEAAVIKANSIGKVQADGNIEAQITANTRTNAPDVLGSIALVESIDGSIGLAVPVSIGFITATGPITSVFADVNKSAGSNINTPITGASIYSVIAGGSIGNLVTISITAVGTATAPGDIGVTGDPLSGIQAESGSIGVPAHIVTISTSNTAGVATLYGDISNVLADVDTTLGSGNNTKAGGGIVANIDANDVGPVRADGNIDVALVAHTSGTDSGDIAIVESLDGSVGIVGGGATENISATGNIPGGVLADVDQSAHNVGVATDINTDITGKSIGPVTAGGNIGNGKAITIQTPTTGTTIGAVTAEGGSIGSGAFGITISAAGGIGAITAKGGPTSSIDALTINGNNDSNAAGTGIASITANGTINFDTITTDDGADILKTGPSIGPITSLGGSILDRAGGAAASITSGGDVGDIKAVTPGQSIGTYAAPIAINLDGDIDLVSAPGSVAGGVAGAGQTVGTHVTINAGHVVAGTPLITIVNGSVTYTIDATDPFGDAALWFDIGTATSGATPDVGLSSITGTTLATTLKFGATGSNKIDLIGIDVDPTVNPSRFFTPLAPDAFGEIDLGTILVQGNLGRTDGAGSPSAGFIDVDDGQAPDNIGRVTYIQIDGTVVAGSKIQVESLGFIGVAAVLPPGTIVLPAAAPVVPTELTDQILVVPKGLTKGWFFTTADGATALGPTGFDDPRDGVPFAQAVYITARPDSDAIVKISINGSNSEGDDYIIGDVTILSGSEAAALGYTGIVGGALGFEATTGVKSLTETGPDLDFVETEGPLGSLTLLSMPGPSTPGDRLGSVSVGFWIGEPGVDDQVVPASFIANPYAASSLFPFIGQYTSIINPGLDGVAGSGNDDFILWGGAANLGPVEVQDGSVRDIRFPQGELNFEIAASGSVSSVLVHRVNLTEGQGDPLNLESIICGDNFIGPLNLPDGSLTGFVIAGAAKVISLGPDLNADTSFDTSGSTPVPGSGQDDIFETIPVNDPSINLFGLTDGAIAFDLYAEFGFNVFGLTPLGSGSIGTAAAPTEINSAGTVEPRFFSPGIIDYAWISAPDGVYADITIGGNLNNYGIYSLRGPITGPIDIGGDMYDSEIYAWQDVGNVVIAGEMDSSTIGSDTGNIGDVTIGREMDNSDISADTGNVGNVIIGQTGSLVGSENYESSMIDSSIYAFSDVASVTIGNLDENIGDMYNSAIIADSGSIGPISVGRDMENVYISAGLNVGDITVGRDILADGYDDLHIIARHGTIGDITVGDDIENAYDGDGVYIFADQGIGNISVNDSIINDSYYYYGTPIDIVAISGSIGDITVGLDVNHKPNNADGLGIYGGEGVLIVAQQNIGTIDVKEGFISGDVIISAGVSPMTDWYASLNFPTSVNDLRDFSKDLRFPGIDALFTGNIAGVVVEKGGIIANGYDGIIISATGDITNGVQTGTVSALNAGVTATYENLAIQAGGAMGPITIGGSLNAGSNKIDIHAGGDVGTITVKGKMLNDVDIRTAGLAGLVVTSDMDGGTAGIDIVSKVISATTFAGYTAAILVGGSMLNTINITASSIASAGNAITVGYNGVGNINPGTNNINIKATGTNGNIGNITVRDIIGSNNTGSTNTSISITSEDGAVGNIVAGRIGVTNSHNTVSVTARTAIGDIVTLDDAVEGILNTTLRVTSATGTIGDIIAHGDIDGLTFLDFDGSIGDIVSLNGYVDIGGFTFGGSVGDVYASEGIYIDNVTLEAGNLGLDGNMSSDIAQVTDTSINKADATLAYNSSLGTWTVNDGLNRARPDGAPADGIYSQASYVDIEYSTIMGSVGNIFAGGEGAYIGNVLIGGSVGNITGTADYYNGVDIENANIGGSVGDITGSSAGGEGFYMNNTLIGGSVGDITGTSQSGLGVEIWNTNIAGNVGNITGNSQEYDGVYLSNDSLGGSVGDITGSSQDDYGVYMEEVKIVGVVGDITGNSQEYDGVYLYEDLFDASVGNITGTSQYGDGVYIDYLTVGGNVGNIQAVASSMEIYDTSVVGNVGNINAFSDLYIGQSAYDSSVIYGGEGAVLIGGNLGSVVSQKGSIGINIVVDGNITDIFAQEGDILYGSLIRSGGNIGNFTAGTGVRAGNFIWDNVTIAAKGTIGVVEARVLGISTQSTEDVPVTVGDTITIPDNDHVMDFQNDYLVIADSNGDNVIELSPVIQAYMASEGYLPDGEPRANLLNDGKIDSQEALDIIAFAGQQLPDITDPDYANVVNTIFQNIFKEVEVVDVDDAISVPTTINGIALEPDSAILTIVAEGTDPTGGRAIGRISSTIMTSTDLYVDATRGGIGELSSNGYLALSDARLADIAKSHGLLAATYSLADLETLIAGGTVTTDQGEDTADIAVLLPGGDDLAKAIIRAKTSIDTLRGDDGLFDMDIQVTGGITIDATKPLDQMITTTGGVGLVGGIVSGGEMEIDVVTGGSIGTTVTTGGSINNNYDAFGNIGSIIAKDSITGTYTAAMGWIGNGITGAVGSQARYVSGGVLAASGDINATFKAGLGAGNIEAPLGNVSGSLATGGVVKGEKSDYVIESSTADPRDFTITLSTDALKTYTVYTTLDTDSGTSAAASMTFTNVDGNSQTINVAGSSSALRVKVGVAFGFVTDVAVTGNGSLDFVSSDTVDAHTANVSTITVGAGASVSVNDINVDGDLGGFININKNATVANITAAGDIGSVVGYGAVQEINAGGSISEVKSLWKDVKNVFAGEDIDKIFAFKNVQNVGAQGRISQIVAGKNVKIVNAFEMGTISGANVSKITAIGDIDLISASTNATDVSSGGDIEVVAGKNATRISALSGKVSLGGKASKVSYNLEILKPPKAAVVFVDPTV
jgi:hypothetical protein